MSALLPNNKMSAHLHHLGLFFYVLTHSIVYIDLFISIVLFSNLLVANTHDHLLNLILVHFSRHNIISFYIILLILNKFYILCDLGFQFLFYSNVTLGLLDYIYIIYYIILLLVVCITSRYDIITR